MNRVEAGILGGYLALLSRNNYSHTDALEPCLREVKPAIYRVGEAFPVQLCVEKLKENITTMKKHIEMAEHFLDDLEKDEAVE